MKTWIKEEKIPLSLAVIYLTITIIIKMLILQNRVLPHESYLLQSYSVVLILNTIIEAIFLFILSSYLTQRYQLRTFNLTSILYITIVPIVTFFASLLLQLFQFSDFTLVDSEFSPALSAITAFWSYLVLLVASVYCLALPNICFFQWQKNFNPEAGQVKNFHSHQNILYSTIIFLFILAPLVVSYALMFTGFTIIVSILLAMIGITISLTYLYFWHKKALNQLNDQALMLKHLQRFALTFIIGYALITTVLLALISLFPEMFLYISLAPLAGLAEKAGLIWTYIFGIACFIGLFYFSDDTRYKTFHALVFIITALGVTLFLSIQGGSWGFYVALHIVGPALFMLGAFLLILGGYSKFILRQCLPKA